MANRITQETANDEERVETLESAVYSRPERRIDWRRIGLAIHISRDILMVEKFGNGRIA